MTVSYFKDPKSFPTRSLGIKFAADPCSLAAVVNQHTALYQPRSHRWHCIKANLFSCIMGVSCLVVKYPRGSGHFSSARQAYTLKHVASLSSSRSYADKFVAPPTTHRLGHPLLPHSLRINLSRTEKRTFPEINSQLFEFVLSVLSLRCSDISRHSE